MSAHISTPPLDGDSSSRKRVCKACDRCRLKKSKCDGTTPCSRCRADNAICVFGERKKSHDKVYPKGYVEMLEQQQMQLVNGLQELYKRSVCGQSWIGPVLQDLGTGPPLTHDILESLGVLKQYTRSDVGGFEDDLEVLQRKLIAGGASFEQQQDSPETEPDTSPIQMSPIQMSFFESLPQKNVFNDSFMPSQMPTPPVQSPQPRSMMTSYLDTQLPPEMAQTLYTSPQKMTSMNPGVLQHPQTWAGAPTIYDDSMDFQQYDRSVNFVNVKLEQQQRPVAMGDNPSNLAFPDWSEDDFGKFLDTTMA